MKEYLSTLVLISLIFSASRQCFAQSSISTISIGSNEIVVGTAGQGVWKTSINRFRVKDLVSGAWKNSTSNLPDTHIFSIATDEKKIIVGTASGVFFLNHNLKKWKKARLPSSSCGISSIAINGDDFFVGTCDDFGVYSSKDAGDTWAIFDSGLGNTSVQCLAICENDLFAGTTSGLYKFNGTEKKWTFVGNGLPLTRIHCLAVDGTVIMAGTDHTVYISSDEGQTWSSCDSMFHVSDVSALSLNGRKLFAATNKGLYFSSDLGKTWQENNYPSYIHCLAFDHGNLFAGTDLGVFVSTNNGAEWNEVGDLYQSLEEYSVDSVKELVQKARKRLENDIKQGNFDEANEILEAMYQTYARFDWMEKDLYRLIDLEPFDDAKKLVITLNLPDLWYVYGWAITSVLEYEQAALAYGEDHGYGSIVYLEFANLPSFYNGEKISAIIKAAGAHTYQDIAGFYHTVAARQVLKLSLW